MRNIRSIIIFSFFLLFSLNQSVVASSLTDEAKSIYKKYHRAVFQIRVISRETGEKAALGSGFQFTKDGYLGTNYHVVSDAVLFPRLYYVEAIQSDGTTQRVEILNIDPVHDLAILKVPQALDSYLKLGTSEFDKGTKIFSFGNPYDLGMTIIEGLYNGLMERAMYRKILFSGSLNPGMSGGPALGRNGKILGVNASTAGNQISFFVPVEYLKEIFREIVDGENIGNDWKKLIRQRLVANQDSFVEKLIAIESWDKRQIGGIYVPGEISNEFKCWGQSGDNSKNWVKYAYLMCSTEDDIFLSSSMYTGSFSFKYTWLQSRGFNPFRFYNIYQEFAENSVFNLDNVEERDAENFECDADYLRLDGRNFQVSTCIRAYDNYEGVYDLNVKMSSVGMFDRGLTVDVVALGITEKQGEDFMRKFLSEIQWQK